MASKAQLDLVGPAEVARRLGVQRQTVAVWRMRGVAPPPLATCSGVPVWDWGTLEKWAKATKRWPEANQPQSEPTPTGSVDHPPLP
jgi:hypothetical protein